VPTVNTFSLLCAVHATLIGAVRPNLRTAFESSRLPTWRAFFKR